MYVLNNRNDSNLKHYKTDWLNLTKVLYSLQIPQLVDAI